MPETCLPSRRAVVYCDASGGRNSYRKRATRLGRAAGLFPCERELDSSKGVGAGGPCLTGQRRSPRCLDIPAAASEPFFSAAASCSSRESSNCSRAERISRNVVSDPLRSGRSTVDANSEARRKTGSEAVSAIVRLEYFSSSSARETASGTRIPSPRSANPREPEA